MDWATIVLDALTLMLDVLTLFIVIASFKAIGENLKQSREALEESRKQSREALEEGRRQSQAALAVANTQIQESRKQSQDAIAAIYKQIEQSKQQAQQENFAENRPLLLPSGKPTFQGDKPNWLDWNVNDQEIALHNIGSGAALNVASVIYGCESYLTDWATNQRSDASKGIHWTSWLGIPIASKAHGIATHKKGNGNFYEAKMHVGQYGFNAPPEPHFNPNANQSFITARITITYYDIFRRKHASIFDYVQHTGGWQLVEFLEDIAEDLHDLEGLYKVTQNVKTQKLRSLRCNLLSYLAK